MPGATTIRRMKQGNLPKIFLYGVIDVAMSEAFALELQWLKKEGYTEFDLHINSKGGETVDGIAIYNAMRGCGMLINGYIDGIAASMASVIALTCNKLYMSKYSRFLAHKPSGGAWGNAGQLRAMADYIDGIEADMLEIYVNRTGLTEEEVKAQFLNGKDNIYTAKQAMEAKFIDGTFDGEEIEIPEGDAFDIEMLYNSVQATMELKFSTNMNEVTIPITAELAKVLGVTASADGAAVTAAIKKLHGKALQADVYKQQLEEFKNATIANEVTAMLDEAQTAKKITPQQHTVFAKQFADNPEDLKEVLDTMGGFMSVTSKLNQTERPAGQYTPQVTALMGKGWAALMQSGEMKTLKTLDAEAYGDLFEQKHGRRP